MLIRINSRFVALAVNIHLSRHILATLSENEYSLGVNNKSAHFTKVSVHFCILRYVENELRRSWATIGENPRIASTSWAGARLHPTLSHPAPAAGSVAASPEHPPDIRQDQPPPHGTSQLANRSSRLALLSRRSYRRGSFLCPMARGESHSRIDYCWNSTVAAELKEHRNVGS